jgi:hypothetical protein
MWRGDHGLTEILTTDDADGHGLKTADFIEYTDCLSADRCGLEPEKNREGKRLGEQGYLKRF